MPLQSMVVGISAIIFIVMVVLITFASSMVTSKNAVKTSYELYDTQVRGISGTLEYMIKVYINDMKSYTNDTNLQKLLRASVKEVTGTKNADIVELRDSYQEEFQEICEADEYILNYFVVNADGIIYSSLFPEAVGTDLSQREYFLRAMAGETNIISDVLYSDRLESYVNMIALPIMSGQQVTGVVVAALSSSAFSNTVAEFGDATMEYYITDCSGALVFSPFSQELGTTFETEELSELVTNTELISGQIELIV